MKKIPDVIAYTEPRLVIKRRGMGDTVDIAGDIKAILVETLKSATNNYKINYLSLSKAKAMRDLLVFRSEDLNKQIEDYVNKLKVSIPNDYYYIKNFMPSFNGEKWGGSSLSGFGYVKSMLDWAQAIKNANSYTDLINSFRDLTNGGGVGLDERYNFMLSYKEKISEYLIAAGNLQSELDKANDEVKSRSQSLPQYEKALNEALNNAQKYIPNLPTISQIQERLDKGLDPLSELNPPEPVQTLVKNLDVVPINTPIEEKPKSKLPLVAGVAAIALTFLSKGK